MRNQYIVSFYKLCRLPFVYLGAILLIVANAAWGYLKLSTLEGMNLYKVFSDACCDTSFTFISTLVSSWFIGSDFGNRTIQHEIKLGYSRVSVIIVRAVPVFLTTIVLHSIGILSAMLGLGVKAGFSMDGFSGRDVWWCITIALQIIAFQSIIILIAFCLRSFGPAIAASVCFTFFACNVLRNYTDAKVFLISCFCLVRDSSNETLIGASVFAAAVIVVMFLAACTVFGKAEIK